MAVRVCRGYTVSTLICLGGLARGVFTMCCASTVLADTPCCLHFGLRFHAPGGHATGFLRMQDDFAEECVSISSDWGDCTEDILANAANPVSPANPANRTNLANPAGAGNPANPLDQDWKSRKSSNLSESLRKSPKGSESLRKSPEVFGSLRKSPKVSENLRKSGDFDRL